MPTRPTVGLLAMSGGPTDPEIAAHHQGYLGHVTRRMASVSDVISGPSAGSAGEIADAVAQLSRLGADGLVLAALGESGLPGSADVLAHTGLPLLVAGIQPERAIGEDWTPYDLSFNRSIAATQELAGQLTRAGVAFSVLTGDWLSDRFLLAFGDWARAAHTRRAVASEPPGDLLNRAAQTLVEAGCMCRMQTIDRSRNAILIGPCQVLAAARGPVTVAALDRVDEQRIRLVVAAGEIVDAAQPPQIDGQYLLFSPDRPLEAFLEAWLAAGASADFLIAVGDSRSRWQHLARMLDADQVEI